MRHRTASQVENAASEQWKLIGRCIMRGNGEPRRLRHRCTPSDVHDGLAAEDVPEVGRDEEDGGASSPSSVGTCVTVSSVEDTRAHNGVLNGKKEATVMEGRAEIDTVVACLSVCGRCFVSETRGGRRRLLTLRLWLTICFCGILTLLVLHSLQTQKQHKRKTGSYFDPRNMVLRFGRGRREVPILGAVCTHHRSGTVLFLSVGEKWCMELQMDYERTGEALQLSDPSQTTTLEYQHYYGAKEKIVVGMHGFAETCMSGQSVGDQCGLLDWECWLTACNMTHQRTSAEFPVVHVVRNPVEALISAYLYHQKDDPVPEGWLEQPKPDALEFLPDAMQEEFRSVPYYQVLQRLPPEQGLRVEYTVEKEDLYRMARNYRDIAHCQCGLNIKYEDILDDYRPMLEKVAVHLKLMERYDRDEVMKIAMKLDIKNMSNGTRKDYGVDVHVTEGKHDKAALRRVLSYDEDLRSVFVGLADALDYPNPFVGLPS